MYKSKYAKLIQHLMNEHDLILLDSEQQEIEKWVDKDLKAINYSQCCEGLKVDKNYIDFEDWKKRHIIDRNHFDNTFLHDTEGWIEEHRLIDKYNSEVMNI